MKKNIARYVRESTREQAMNGYNLSDQKKKILYYLKAYENDYELVDYEDGGYSAKSIKRPALQKLLLDIKHHKINVVIIHNLDRLTRRIKDLIWLLEYFQSYNVKLISITEKLDTDSASGKFFTYLLCLIAQWEQDTISERTLRGLKESAEQGNYVRGGRTPFGFIKENGKLIANPKEKAIIIDIFDLTINSFSSEKVATTIQEKYCGFDFNAEKIIRIIKNTVYNGYFIFQGKKYILDDKFVSDDVFEEANQLVSRRSRTKKYQYAFQDLVFTENNRKMVCVCGKSKGKVFLYYTDKKNKLTISEADIKAAIFSKLSRHIGQKDISFFINEKKALLKDNLAKQKKIIDLNVIDSSVFKELVLEQKKLEILIKTANIKHRHIFLNSLSPMELNEFSKKYIKKIIVCNSKRVMVVFKL